MTSKEQQADAKPPVARGRDIAAGAGAGMILGWTLGNPGVGLVIGAGLGLVAGPVIRRQLK